MKLPDWGDSDHPQRDARITLGLALLALGLFAFMGIQGWPGA